MVRDIRMPASWLRGVPAAAAQENASADTGATPCAELFEEQPAAVAAANGGGAAYAAFHVEGGLSPPSVCSASDALPHETAGSAFSAVHYATGQQNLAGAAAAPRRATATAAAAGDAELGGTLRGAAEMQPRSSRGCAVACGDGRGGLGTEEEGRGQLRAVVSPPTSAAAKGEKLPFDDFDSGAAPTAATLFPETEDVLSDQEDVKSSNGSVSVSRGSVAALHRERTVVRTPSEGGLVSKKERTGFFATGVIILKSFVGGAFLFLPHAVMKAGIVSSFLTVTGIFALAVYCMTLLVRCCEASERQAAAAGAGRDGGACPRSSIEGNSSRFCSTTMGSCSDDSSSGSSKEKSKKDSKSERSFRWLLRRPHLLHAGGRKDSSTSSGDSTRTGGSGGGRCSTEESEEPQGETITINPTRCIVDSGGAVIATPAAVQQQHQQLVKQVCTPVPLRQQKTAGQVTVKGTLLVDEAGSCRGGEDDCCVVRENKQQQQKISEATEQYDCQEVVVASVPGGPAGEPYADGTSARTAAEDGCRGKAAEEEKEEQDIASVAAEVIGATAAEVAEAAASVKETTSQALLCSYEGVARLACGIWGERLIEACVVLSQLAFATVNVVIVSGNVRDVVWTAADCAPAYNWSLKAIIWSAALLYVPLCMIRRMKHLVPVALLANVGTAVGVVLLMVSISLHLAEKPQRQPSALPLAHMSQWPLILGTSIYLWEGAGLVLPIRQEAKQKVQKRFSSFFAGSLGFLLLLYLIYTLTCCLAFRDQLQIIILFNLSSGPLSLTVQMIFALAILATYPLMMFPALAIVERHLKARSWVQRLSGSSRGFVVAYVVRALFGVLTLGAATLGMRQLDDFVALIGGVCGAPLVFVFPVFFHMRLVEESRFRRLLHCCVIAAGVAIQAFSIYWSIASWKGDNEFAARCLQQRIPS